MNAPPPDTGGDHAAPADRRGIDLAPVGMLITDGNGHVVASNQAWTELSGLSGPDSVGDGFLAALGPGERAHLQDEIRRAAVGPDPVSGDHHLGVGSIRRWTRWWLRREGGGNGPLVVIAVGDISGGGRHPMERYAPADLPIEVADGLILRLNAVAYTLASCARIIDDQAATRIEQAIADLDRVIDDLRTTDVQPDLAEPFQD